MAGFQQHQGRMAADKASAASDQEVGQSPEGDWGPSYANLSAGLAFFMGQPNSQGWVRFGPLRFKFDG